MKKLPIGISTLEKIIQDDFVYVDKTVHIQELTKKPGYYFLSRPRRFGKSLLLDTLHQLFAGNEPLFRGLHIHPHWDWSLAYPVIRLSFGSGIPKNKADLDRSIQRQLRRNQQLLGVTCTSENDSVGCFAELIQKAADHYGQPVVVLVDEYDKPILDNVTDDATATVMRNGLRDLYSVIKDNDADIRFAFLTGVSKFSKVSIFSGLNNLNDISMDTRYSALCGYTQAELEHYFAEHLQGADFPLIREWYNGYGWLGERVYNPFDILLFIDKNREYLSYWFSTGTPTFLVEVLKARHFHLPDLESVKIGANALEAFDIGRIELVALLFQTGYLTIKSKEITFGGQPEYTLSYPNREVRYSLTQHLLENYLLDHSQERHSVYQAFLKNDFAALERRFRTLFDEIAHQNHTNNRLAEYEGYYASVMYAFLCSLGMDTRAEESSNKGRVDIALRFTLPDGQKQVYIFEFKMVEGDTGDGSALAQIRKNDYAARYRDGQQRIFLIGIEFSKQVRNIVGYQWEEDLP
ncbi:ATP-binding protein [Thiothrix nivea]|uniref:AAA-ATPase-like protein n=1 Tax=Thiothrix nivea (strain ATCC 35100 / DSM 5205 / JP2) TaxID=870187 RepID=A0A656HIH8_THINJ|nr:ATP-binding protein [Thiothrix nivea]EIJ36728.1 AAA-ATPase-like protein [Thiothrix nivea DSM 5205]